VLGYVVAALKLAQLYQDIWRHGGELFRGVEKCQGVGNEKGFDIVDGLFACVANGAKRRYPDFHILRIATCILRGLVNTVDLAGRVVQIAIGEDDGAIGTLPRQLHGLGTKSRVVHRGFVRVVQRRHRASLPVDGLAVEQVVEGIPVGLHLDLGSRLAANGNHVAAAYRQAQAHAPATEILQTRKAIGHGQRVAQEWPGHKGCDHGFFGFHGGNGHAHIEIVPGSG